MRLAEFGIGEYYHVFNRGVEKRDIVCDEYDVHRFLQSMQMFNTKKPIGSIFETNFSKKKNKEKLEHSLVSFIAYCINPNHYHFLLRQEEEYGVSKFMHKFGTGYTNYFNEKYERSGSLCQGKFKARHIASNEDLLHISAYVNLNYKVHNIPLGSWIPKSSWDEYVGEKKEQQNKNICDMSVITQQFRRKYDYKKFAQESIRDIIRKRRQNIIDLLLE